MIEETTIVLGAFILAAILGLSGNYWNYRQIKMLEKQIVENRNDGVTFRELVESLKRMVDSYDRQLISIEKQIATLSKKRSSDKEAQALKLEIEKQKNERQKRKQEEKLIVGLFNILTK